MADFDRILEEATEEERLRLAMRSRQARILGNSRERMSIVTGEQDALQGQDTQETSAQSTGATSKVEQKPSEEKSDAKLRPLANRRRRVMQQKLAEAAQAETETTANTQAQATAETAAAAPTEATMAEKDTVDNDSQKEAPASATEEAAPTSSLLSSIPTAPITNQEDLAARPLLRRRMIASRATNKSDEDLAAAAMAATAAATVTPVVPVEDIKPKLAFLTAGRALRLVFLTVCMVLGGISGMLGAFRMQGTRDLVLQHHGYVTSNHAHDPSELPTRGQLQRYRDMLSQPSRKIGLMNDPDKHGHHAHTVDEFEAHSASASAQKAGHAHVEEFEFKPLAFSAAVPALAVAGIAWVLLQSTVKPLLDKTLPPDPRGSSGGGILAIATSFLGGLNNYLTAGRAILEHTAVFAFAAVVGGAIAEYILRS